MVAGPYNPDAFNPAQRPDENMPDRSTLGWARDVAIDTTRGIGKMVSAVPAIASDVFTPSGAEQPVAHEGQEAGRAFDELMAGLKTPKGQFKERTGRDDAGLAQRATEAIITSAPALVAGALTGGVGSALLFGAQGYGDYRNESEAKIYGATEDELAKRNPKYVDLRQSGMSDAQARHQLYSDSLDVGGAIATTLGGVIGGYGPGRVLGKGLTRSATEITDRLIKRVPLSAAEGATGMAVMGGTSEFGRQRADIASGFRDTMDPDAILKQTLEGGEVGGIMGALAGIPRRGPRRAEPERKPEQKPAEPLNADTLATTAEQLGRPGEAQPSDWGGLQKHVEEQTQEPSPFGPSGPLAPPDEPGAPPPPPPGAGPPPPAPTPRARAAAPTPPPAAPAVSAFPREELFRRAVDPTLTPDHGTLLKHIAEWQAANPGEKLGADRNVLQKQAKAAREEARKAAKVTPAGKVVEASPIVPPEPVVPEGERAEQARTDQVASDTRGAELEAEAQAAVTRANEKAQALAEEKIAAQQEPPVTEPKGPLSGEAAAPVLAQKAEERVQRAARAADVQATEPAKAEARAVRAEARATQREDEATKREQVAKETREEHTPGANMQAENTAVRTALAGAADHEVPGFLKPVMERAKAILKDYGSRLYELAGKTRKHEVFGAFDPGASAQAGPKAGPYHHYMATLHNFVRNTAEALRNHQFEKARNLGLGHLDTETRMLTEGGAEQMLKERREKSQKITATKREVVHDERVEVETTTEHEQQLKAEAEQEARIDKGPKATVKPGVAKLVGRDKFGRLKFQLEKNDKAEWVGGKQMPSDPYVRSQMQTALENESRRIGRALTSSEARDVFRRYENTIQTGTYGDLLPGVRPTHAILRAIFDRVHELVKDIPVTIWSRDAMDVYMAHHGQGSARAAHSTELGEGIFRRDALIPRTIFHEALHAATARAIDTSPRFEHLIKRIQNIAASHYLTDPMRKELAFQRGVVFGDPKEFIAELFSRPELGDMLSKIELKPYEARNLMRAGYTPGRGATLLKALWDGFLKAIGFKTETPNAYKVAVDLTAEMFDREKAFQRMDIASGEPIGTMSSARAINLRQTDPVQNRLIEQAISEGKHGTAVEKIMDLAEKIMQSGDEVGADTAIEYLRRLNDQAYGSKWIPEEVTPLSNPQSVFDGALKFLNDRGGNLGKEVAFRAGRPASALRSVAGYGLTWTRKLKEMGEQPFRDVMSPAIDFLAKHGAFAQRYMTNGGQHSSEPAQKLLSDLADLKHSIKDRELWDRFEQFMVRESAHGAYADEALHVGRNAHIDKNDLVDEQTRQEHAEVQKEWKEIADRSPQLKEMRDRLHKFGAAEQEARSRALVSDMAVHLEMVPASDKVGREAIVKRVRNEQDTWTPAEKARIDELANHPDYEENIRDIKKTRELVKLAGPYVPFMRRGQHSLMSKYKVEPDKGVDFKPTNAEPKDGVHEGFDFANLADAKKFITDKLNANGLSQREGHEVVLDTTTGKAARVYSDAEFEKAQAEGKAEWEKEHGPDVPYPPKVNRVITAKEFKEEPDKYGHAELRHRVTFNPRDYQLFESEREAHEEKARREASDKSGLTITTEVERAPDHMSRANSPQTSNEMQRLIDRLEGKKSYQNLTPSEQAKVKRDLLLESMRIQTTSARRSRFLPRTYARGASTDILRNYMEMANSQAHSMADLTYRGDIAASIAAIDEYNQGHQYAQGAAERQMAASELKHRAYAPPLPNNAAMTAISRALRISGVAHLADLGYLAMNALDNWMNALPVVGGRHGYYASAKELLRSSKLFEPSAMAKAAFGDIVQAAQRKPQTVKYQELANQMIDAGVPDLEEATRLKQNLHNIFEKGLISPDAGMEVERLRNLDANIAGQQFERVDGVFRAASTGVETHNRLSLATQAYRLEYLKNGGDHVQAMQYAEDTIFKGAGDYAAWNRPRMVNQPWLRLGMQFKQFPMRIMANYADAIMGTARGDKEKMKQLAFMLATQSVATGALGLPLGPMSGAVNAAYMLGFTDKNWDDQVAGMRQWVAKNTTPAIAEVLFHGLGRTLGIDTSRLGQNSFIFFGSPDTQKPVDNLKSGMWMLAGAPGDMLRKWDDGIHQATEAWNLYQNGAHEQARAVGVQAATNLIQVKAFTDIGRAFLQASGGPATKTRGGMPLGNEYTTYHAILRAIGITPAAEAEASEKRSIVKRDQTRLQQGHTAAMQMFINANDKELGSIFRGIQENYNPGKPADQQITYGQLLRARFQAQQAAHRDISGVGVRVSNKNRSLAQERSYYNTGP